MARGGRRRSDGCEGGRFAYLGTCQIIGKVAEVWMICWIIVLDR